MIYLIFLAISFFSSLVGSICGIGGGVIIKPVLDAFGIMSVSSISFLSGCTVLSMSAVSIFKALRNRTARLDFSLATPLALGAAVGGLLGNTLFHLLRTLFGDENRVGFVQSVVMLLVLAGCIWFTANKARIRTFRWTGLVPCALTGALLGILSSFLGIGGGPINIVLLCLLFSMASKDAALCSIYIILFSQVASLAKTLATRSVPPVSPLFLAFMVAGGVCGALAGSHCNRRISDRTVDRLFMGLMALLTLINCYNAWRFWTA